MAGYMLIEKRTPPSRTRWMASRRMRRELGFIDYLRELRQEVFPLCAWSSKLAPDRIRKRPLATVQDRQQIAADVHGLLAARANEFDNEWLRPGCI